MFVRNAKKLFAAASLFSILISQSGCGIWTDFTTYFNTYYNAKLLFTQVEEDIKNQKKDIFIFREDLQSASQYGNQYGSQYGNQSGTQYQQQNVSNQFGNQQPAFDARNQSNPGQYTGAGTGTLLSGNMNDNLKRVVEKCSKILQYEKNSSYFPDALFITGKALYYQQEYARAQRKFTELAGLSNEKYSSENKLWLAKTHLQLRNFEEGLKLIDEVKSESVTEGDDDLYNDASITKISFLIFRNDLRGALDECKGYLAQSRDDEISALVAFQMGKINLNLNDPQKAIDAFSTVSNYSPTVDVDFKSRFESAKLLKLLKKFDESEAAFNELRYLGKFKNYLDQILIEVGQINLENNRINAAIDIFREVDTTYRQFPTSGMAEMKLAEIYHKKLGLYDSSYTYYTKASISMGPREIKLEAGKRATDFNKYFGFKDEARELSVKLDYINSEDVYIRDSIEYQIAHREYLENVKVLEEVQKSDPSLMNQSQLDPSYYQQQYNQQQLAFFQRPKKGFIPTKAQLIAVGKYKKPERPKLSADSTKTILSQSLYNLASLFYSELDVPDSAYYYFNKILNDFPNKPVKVQTMYALATYYETHNDSLKADSLFRIIYKDFNKNPLGLAAAQKLGLIKNEDKRSEIKVSDDPGEKDFQTAEQLYYDKKYSVAIDSFKTLYKKFPESSFAPKSVYYVGMIYEKDLKMYDSAASAYLVLTRDFAKSPLAGQVAAKYSEYKNEKDKIRMKEEALRKEKEELRLKEEEKQKEMKAKELKKSEPNPVNADINKKTANGYDKINVSGLVKDSLMKSDTAKIKDIFKVSGDSIKVKSDTTKRKLPPVEK